MVANKASLTALFETGDVPTGADYANMIDSSVNLAETSAQSMAGPLITTEVITPRVSADNGNFTGTVGTGALTVTGALQVTGDVSAGNYYGGTARFSGIVSAQGLNASSSITAFGMISTGGVRVATDVSADSGKIYASANRWGNGTVSAAGTAQGTAAALTFTINEGRGIVDGATTGFGVLGNRTGWVQYLINTGASANLWPPTGGSINGQAANAVFALAASALYTIVHTGASAYWVK